MKSNVLRTEAGDCISVLRREFGKFANYGAYLIAEKPAADDAHNIPFQTVIICNEVKESCSQALIPFQI